MAGLTAEARDAIFKTVSDPRYDQATYMASLGPAAQLKLAVTAGGLIPDINRAYGWRLPENGNWTVEQANDVIFEIVVKPGYSLEAFIAAVRSGRSL